jgi:hypothetical protein
MKTIYDVDVCSNGTKEKYKKGELIDWSTEMTYESRSEALKYCKGYALVSGVRVVEIKDPEDNPEVKDIWVWFKN